MNTRSLALRGLRLRRNSDEALLSRAANGDPAAFAEVYRRFSRPVFGYCLARFMDVQAAEDATQEVFLRLLKATRDDIENARAWIFRIARNVCIDSTRGARAAAAAVAVSDEMLDPAADAAVEALRRDDARRIMVALRRLPARYRSALILREIHGMSSADIGDTLGASVGAVDTLVSRARDAFGVKYAETGALPRECRNAIELIYRQMGTGISDAERGRLQTHAVACKDCRKEMRRAQSPRHLGAVLPLVLPAAPSAGLFAHAARVAGIAHHGLGSHIAQGGVVVALALSVAAVPASKMAFDKISADMKHTPVAAAALELPQVEDGADAGKAQREPKSSAADGPDQRGSRKRDARRDGYRALESRTAVRELCPEPGTRDGYGSGDHGGSHDSGSGSTDHSGAGHSGTSESSGSSHTSSGGGSHSGSSGQGSDHSQSSGSGSAQHDGGSERSEGHE